MKHTSNDLQFETIDNTADEQAMVNDLRIFLLIFVLKTLTNKEHPANISSISTYLTNISGVVFNTRTLKRDLLSLSNATSYFQSIDILESNTPSNTTISNAIDTMLGGKIRHIIPKKSHHYFYFESFTRESDIAMMGGAISSSRFFSEQEKRYLLQRLATLNSFVGESQLNITVSQQFIPYKEYIKKPQTFKKDNAELLLPADSAQQLIHIQTIYRAISNNRQIIIDYGNYNTNKKHGRNIIFEKRNKEPYVLNPYALLWNHGQYYLVACFSGSEKPIHFRVDRILNVVEKRTPDDATLFSKREPIPEVLKPYIKTHKEGYYEFLSTKYTADFPLLMAIFAEDEFIDTVVECSEGTLSLLIDTFGTDITVAPSSLPHDVTKDYNGKDVNFIVAKINHVQYNNMLLFCLQQQATVTNEFSPIFAIYPPRLVDDISKHMKESLKRYQAFQEKSNDLPHPFISNQMLS